MAKIQRDPGQWDKVCAAIDDDDDDDDNKNWKNEDDHFENIENMLCQDCSSPQAEDRTVTSSLDYRQEPSSKQPTGSDVAHSKK